MDFSNLLNFIDGLILLIVFLLLYAGHRTPWHVLPVLVADKGKRELHRLLAYVYGVGCILFAAWLHTQARQIAGLSDGITFGFLCADAAAAAAGTLMPRLIERQLDKLSKAQMTEQREARIETEWSRAN